MAGYDDTEGALVFRVETACGGLGSLREDDVPEEYDDREVDAYIAGAARAAADVLSVLHS